MDELIFITQVKVVEILYTKYVIHSQDIEELIADSMTGLLIRSERLNELDQIAISEEFREWLNEGVRLDDVLKLETKKNNH